MEDVAYIHILFLTYVSGAVSVSVIVYAWDMGSVFILKKHNNKIMFLSLFIIFKHSSVKTVLFST